MKKISRFVVIAFICLIFLSSCCPTFTTRIYNLDSKRFTTKYGQLKTQIWAPVFLATGYGPGDVVNVSLSGKSFEAPVVTGYEQVGSGMPAVVINGGTVLLAENMGDFVNDYSSDDFPITLSISLVEKGGFPVADFVSTNIRKDYSQLTDEQFANFRKVNTANMRNLYRTSSPIDPELGRNKYADAAIKRAGVTVILNLADSKESAESKSGFKKSYYSTCKVKYLNLGVDIQADDFEASLADGLKFLAENKGIYAVHCKEGKDRAGYVSALLECFMGASAAEVADDYLETYCNYYGIEKGSGLSKTIVENNIVGSLQRGLGIDDFWSADLQKAAEDYFHRIGLSYNEIESLRNNLSI